MPTSSKLRVVIGVLLVVSLSLAGVPHGLADNELSTECKSCNEEYSDSSAFSEKGEFGRDKKQFRRFGKKKFRCFGKRKCAPRNAVKFLGNVCWDVSIPSLGNSLGSLRLGVTHMGGGHFALNGVLGSIDEGADEVEFSLVRGNAEMVEGELRVSLINTAAEVFDDPFLGNNLEGNGAVIFNLFLDPGNLDGSGLAGGMQTGSVEELNILGYLGPVTVKKISCKDVIWRQ